MARFTAIEDMQAETRRNHSTTEAELELTATAGQRPLSGLSHGIEVLLTTKEASQVLKIHPKVLERMAKRGEVPALKVGKFWRYRATTLDAWISSRLKSDRQPCRMKTSF